MLELTQQRGAAISRDELSSSEQTAAVLLYSTHLESDELILTQGVKIRRAVTPRAVNTPSRSTLLMSAAD